ncbi:hypothetical protein ACRQF6_05470 [Actinotignum sp. GS-2025f]|uniref:hypothetical protein n=1 Tax=unclassified Actinotignum TaxID=2632702 RepID=UPI002A81EB2E|nr:hypothetical protein [Actinotignum sp. SLA_B059]MDY5127159.1 hypothetical protein [Actinotignum sp. SLA_B059]
MNIWWWLALVAGVVLLLLGLSAVVAARRLDRLHTTLLKSRRAVEQALAARARTAYDMAMSGELDMAGALILTDSAQRVLSASMLPVVADGLEALPGDTRDDLPDPAVAARERRAVESELSRALRLTVDELDPNDITDAAAREFYRRLERARLDVRMTRSFHNSHVDQARRVRNSRILSIFPIAGHAPVPQTIDIDDE